MAIKHDEAEVDPVKLAIRIKSGLRALHMPDLFIGEWQMIMVALMKESTTLSNNLCPDHRDKQIGKPCLACTIEILQSQLPMQDAWWTESCPQEFPVSEAIQRGYVIAAADADRIGFDKPHAIAIVRGLLHAVDRRRSHDGLDRRHKITPEWPLQMQKRVTTKPRRSYDYD